MKPVKWNGRAYEPSLWLGQEEQRKNWTFLLLTVRNTASGKCAGKNRDSNSLQLSLFGKMCKGVFVLKELNIYL